MAQFWQVSTGFLLAWVLAALPAKAASPRGQTLDTPPAVEHKVTRGETLWSISQKHHTSVGAVMDYNHLSDHTVREGMVLRIPPKVVVSAPAPRQKKHTVKRGEDFWKVADRYNLKPAALAKANPHVNPSRINSGMELIIPLQESGDRSTKKDSPAPRQAASASTAMVQHTIGENETFYSIARRYGVGMNAVVAANPNVQPERLRAGMKVWVPAKKTGSAPSSTTAALSQQKPATGVATTASKGRSHVIKENESIASIARKYGVSESALLRENKLSEDDPIYVDDSLKIPSAGNAVASSPAATQVKLTATPPKPSLPSAASSPKPKSAATSTASNVVGSDGAIRSYIVSASEDENTICEAFGISKKTLFEYNHLSPTTKLKPGDEIAIPKAKKR